MLQCVEPTSFLQVPNYNDLDDDITNATSYPPPLLDVPSMIALEEEQLSRNLDALRIPHEEANTLRPPIIIIDIINDITIIDYYHLAV